MVGAVIAALAVLVVAVCWFWLRLRALGQRIGSFPCAIRTPSGWTSGIACYGAAELRWYRVVSLSPRPRYVWDRNVFAILGPAQPIDSDQGPGSAGSAGRVREVGWSRSSAGSAPVRTASSPWPSRPGRTRAWPRGWSPPRPGPVCPGRCCSGAAAGVPTPPKEVT